MKKTTIGILLLMMVGCESLQETASIPENTSGTVVDSAREQKEQTEEITDASGAISGTLGNIDEEADSILNGIALASNQNDPLLDSIENNAESIKEHVDVAEKE